jgi:hypothetical protein
MLSKKDYVAIAEIIKNSKTEKEMITGLMGYFSEDNPRFDPIRFMKYINNI